LAQDAIFRPEMPVNIGLRLEYFITPEQYDSCMNDFQKTVEKRKVFNQESFLKFVNLRTNGVIDKDLFDTSILELVYIYWFTVCTVEPELCSEIELVSSNDVTGYYYENGEPLTEEICERIQYYIDRYITSQSPTYSPSLSIEPTSIPSESHMPSSIPSISPTNSPTLLTFTESLSFQIEYTSNCASEIMIEKLSTGLRKQFGCDGQQIQECQFDVEVLISEFFSFGTCVQFGNVSFIVFDVQHALTVIMFVTECIKEKQTPDSLCALISTLTTITGKTALDEESSRRTISDTFTMIVNEESFVSSMFQECVSYIIQ
jgi:hypothetical protein